MFVTIFIFLGVFAVLIGFMPGGFFTYQPEYIAPTTQSKEVAEYFSANNITLYKNQWSFDINLGETKSNQSSLPDGHSVEVHFYESYPAPIYGNVFEIRHAFPSWFFGLWLDFHRLIPDDLTLSKITNPVNARIGLLYKQDMLDIAGGTNSSIFTAYCEHITISIVVLPVNSSLSLEDSWDAGQLHVLSSFEIDFEAMKPSAWTLLAQILTFQSPDLGIPGDGGAILSYIIGAGLWAAIIILAFAAITSIIPTIPGWGGD